MIHPGNDDFFHIKNMESLLIMYLRGTTKQMKHEDIRKEKSGRFEQKKKSSPLRNPFTKLFQFSSRERSQVKEPECCKKTSRKTAANKNEQKLIHRKSSIIS